ncbi:hypothetical protein EON65_17740 [archaeon]|nr:MAG: hypothetical protein EON65_17740 [archaeon]
MAGKLLERHRPTRYIADQGQGDTRVPDGSVAVPEKIATRDTLQRSPSSISDRVILSVIQSFTS